MSPNRTLVVSALAFAVGFAALDVAYGTYVRKHFVPEQVFAGALAAGDGCVLMLGDSRMQAGILASSVEAGLAEGGGPACVAPLGIGAVGVEGAFLALRRYLASPRTPSVVVLGVGTTLAHPAPDPSEMIGNASVLLGWSRASDVEVFYPGFPRQDLDRGLRFSVARTSALSSGASLVWQRVQRMESQLTEEQRALPRNEFGLVGDMQKLGAAFAALDRASIDERDGHFQNDAWVDRIRTLAHAAGARLVVVLVPMPEVYRASVSESAAGRRYSAWLAANVAETGDALVNLRDVANDEQFPDGTHLSKDGAAVFSRALGRALAPVVASHSRVRPADGGG